MIKAEFWAKSQSFLKCKSLLSDKGHSYILEISKERLLQQHGACHKSQPESTQTYRKRLTVQETQQTPVTALHLSFGQFTWKTGPAIPTRMRTRWLEGITNSMDMSLSKTPGDSERNGSLMCCSPQGLKESDTAKCLNSSPYQDLPDLLANHACFRVTASNVLPQNPL